MKTMIFYGKVYWLITAISAVRPHRTGNFDRLEILNIDPNNGEIQYRSRTAPAWLLKTVKHEFAKGGFE